MKFIVGAKLKNEMSAILPNKLESKEANYLDLINDIAHRSSPLPSKNWVMKHTWSNLLFLHWPIHPSKLRPYIPSPLQIDTYDGFAWLGVVVFVIEGIYLRGLSNISLVPIIQEVNVRTYVRYGEKTGVYFLSLDANHWSTYTIAKHWYRLFYHPAKISIQDKENIFHIESIRKGKAETPIMLKGMYTPLAAEYIPKVGMVDHWVTERYCLYSTRNGKDIYCAKIHHRPWVLQQAEFEIETNTLFMPFYMDLRGAKPIAHFSKGVDALIWNINKAKI